MFPHGPTLLFCDLITHRPIHRLFRCSYYLWYISISLFIYHHHHTENASGIWTRGRRVHRNPPFFVFAPHPSSSPFLPPVDRIVIAFSFFFFFFLLLLLPLLFMVVRAWWGVGTRRIRGLGTNPTKSGAIPGRNPRLRGGTAILVTTTPLRLLRHHLGVMLPLRTPTRRRSLPPTARRPSSTTALRRGRGCWTGGIRR